MDAQDPRLRAGVRATGGPVAQTSHELEAGRYRLARLERKNRALRRTLGLVSAALAVAIVAALALRPGSAFRIPLISSPYVKNLRITHDNRDKILDEIADSSGLTVEEVVLLESYLFRTRGDEGAAPEGAGKGAGRTIGEAIEAERDQAREESLRERAEARRREEEKARQAEEREKERRRREPLLAVLAVSFLGKEFAAVEGKDYITLSLTYQNRSDKDVRAFKGLLEFSDLFGEPLLQASLSEDHALAAGEVRAVRRSLDYDPSLDAHRRLRDAGPESVRVEWQPQRIMFADGTSLEVEEPQQAATVEEGAEPR